MKRMFMSHKKIIPRQCGIGLIELMISILIGAFILAGVVQLFSTSLANNRTSEGYSRIQENARYVFNRLENDAIQAGAGGCFNLNNIFSGERIFTTLKNETTGADKYNYTRFVSGVEGANQDTLFLRYVAKQGRIRVKSHGIGDDFIVVDKDDPDYDSLNQFQIVFIGNCSKILISMITNAPGGSNGRIEFKKEVISNSKQTMGQENLDKMASLLDEITDTLSPKGSLTYLYSGDAALAEYKIGDSAAGVCDAVATPENCALLRNGSPIAEGVEEFDVQYGWQDGGALLYASASADPNDPVNNESIDRVKVSIKFNPAENIKTLDGSENINKTFSRVFMLRNTLPVK